MGCQEWGEESDLNPSLDLPLIFGLFLVPGLNRLTENAEICRIRAFRFIKFNEISRHFHYRKRPTPNSRSPYGHWTFSF
jgi:hypothetical protein